MFGLFFTGLFFARKLFEKKVIASKTRRSRFRLENSSAVRILLFPSFTPKSSSLRRKFAIGGPSPENTSPIFVFAEIKIFRGSELSTPNIQHRNILRRIWRRKKIKPQSSIPKNSSLENFSNKFEEFSTEEGFFSKRTIFCRIS